MIFFKESHNLANIMRRGTEHQSSVPLSLLNLNLLIVVDMRLSAAFV